MHLETELAQCAIKADRTLTCPKCRGESFQVVAGEMVRRLDPPVSDPRRPKEPILGFRCCGCGDRIVFLLPHVLSESPSPSLRPN
jgi:hypothetical protein